MKPRILLRTHYQADEPRLIVAASTHCARPTQSADEGNLAECLVRWARSHSLKLSRPGAMYAVDNARNLALLTTSNHWSPASLTLAYVETKDESATDLDSAMALNRREQRLYLLYYLLGAGALLIVFGRWLLNEVEVTDDAIRDKAALESCLISALDQYLTIVDGVRERTAIRKERERMQAQDYASSTQRHKRYPLLRTMLRLGLLEVRRGAHNTYVPTERLKLLTEAVPDISSLERLAKGRALKSQLRPVVEQASEEPSITPGLIQELGSAYAFSESHGMQACPLAFLDDALWSVNVSTPDGFAERTVEALRRELPRDVRFHVDRQGRRAFVALSRLATDKLARDSKTLLEAGLGNANVI
jgi:hypothetical protein